MKNRRRMTIAMVNNAGRDAQVASRRGRVRESPPRPLSSQNEHRSGSEVSSRDKSISQVICNSGSAARPRHGPLFPVISTGTPSALDSPIPAIPLHDPPPVRDSTPPSPTRRPEECAVWSPNLRKEEQKKKGPRNLVRSRSQIGEIAPDEVDDR